MELCSSVECKGIIGNDGRHYILDLLRTFPPDLNFLPVCGEELSADSQCQGFPRQHRHRLACLRQELIEAFVEHRWAQSLFCSSLTQHTNLTVRFIFIYVFYFIFFRYLLFMKMAALQLMHQKANKDLKTDTPAITESSEAKSNTDTTQITATDSSNATQVSTHGTGQKDNSTDHQTTTQGEENSSKPTTNGTADPAGTQNGQCKSQLESKELEESIPGLAQAKELAETLVAEDGSGVGRSRISPKTKPVVNAGRATLVDNCIEGKKKI